MTLNNDNNNKNSFQLIIMRTEKKENQKYPIS